MAEVSLFDPLVTGFTISIALLLAIGPQNAFVIRQGLKREGVGTVTTVTFLCDSLMIMIGVLGIAGAISTIPVLETALGWGGVAFLLLFAGYSFRRAAKGQALHDDTKVDKATSRKSLAAQALAFSVLNPWAWVDTTVLVGGVATQYDGFTLKLWFVAGATAGSAIWFYGVGYGARLASGLFDSPKAWRILDASVGIIMLVIAATLISRLL